MIRCNGYCSEERATPAKRTQVGKTDPSVGRERDCCDVFASFVARSMIMPSRSCKRSPNFTLTGSRLDEPCKTSTFTGRFRNPRSKIEKGFQIRDLALFNMAFCFGPNGQS